MSDTEVQHVQKALERSHKVKRHFLKKMMLEYRVRPTMCQSVKKERNKMVGVQSKDGKNMKLETAGVPGWLSQLSNGLLISTQVMISWFLRSSPASDSGLTKRSLLEILSFFLSLSVPSLVAHSLSFKIDK